MTARDRRGDRAGDVRERRELHAPGKSRSHKTDADVAIRAHGWNAQDIVVSSAVGSATSWYSMCVGVRIALSTPEPRICPPILEPVRASWTVPESNVNWRGVSRSKYRTATTAAPELVSAGGTMRY